MEPLEPRPEAAPETLASVLRRIVLRTAFFGTSFGLAFAVLGLLANAREAAHRPLLFAFGLTLFAVLGGLTIAPLTALELLALRRSASRRRDVATLALGIVVGFASVFVAVVQGAFIVGVVRGRSLDTLDTGYLAVRNCLQEYGAQPANVAFNAAFGVVLAPVILARVRRVALGWELGIALASALLLGAPLLAVCRGTAIGFSDFPALVFLIGVETVGFGLASRAADRLEARVSRRFGWHAEGAAEADVPSPPR